jgi:hypothetical protein
LTLYLVEGPWHLGGPSETMRRKVVGLCALGFTEIIAMFVLGTCWECV